MASQIAAAIPSGEPPPHPNPTQTKDNVVSTKPTTTGTSTAMSPDKPTGGSGDDDDDTVIEFSSTNFYAEDDRVFHTTEAAGLHRFSWFNRGNANLTKISLVRVIGDSGKESDYERIFSSSLPIVAHAAPGEHARIVMRDDGDSPFFAPSDTDNAVQLDLEYFRGQATDFQDGTKVLAIELGWAKSGKPGHSYSGYFAVMYGEEPKTEANLQKKVKKFPNYETGSENLLGEDDSVPAASTKSSDGTVKPTGTIGPGDHNRPGIGPGDPDKGGDGSSSSHVGNGLSKGAIAGIAVGSIVIAFLLGLLAWFLLRRRRKQRQRQQQRGASAHDAPNGYIIDKTADDAAIATTGAHSPYSDDGQGQSQLGLHHGQGDATAASYPVALHQQDQQQQLQHHHHDQRDLPRGDDGGAYTPSQHDSASRNYHHLVEEGMTAEDIRRLEEEERQLDAEIERAGRRGS